MTQEHFDVVVIGSGLIGAAIAHDLVMNGVNALVLEAFGDVGAGVSRSNSGIVHTGFDSVPGELETEMILAQRSRWRSVFDALGVPYRVTGALLLANDEEQSGALDAMTQNAAVNGVETTILDRSGVRRLVPESKAIGALHVPGEAITDPYEVVRRLLAVVPSVRLRRRVTSVRQVAGVAVVECQGGESYAAEFVVNCAGLYGDDVAGDGSFSIRPRRGEFVVYPRGSASLLNHILLPFPTHRTKGVLVFPTIHEHLCAGPSAIDQEDKEDWRPRQEQLDEIDGRAAEVFPPIASLPQSDSWAGLRPVGAPRNYLIEWSKSTPDLLQVAAIRSTGLSSCLGISRLVLEMLVARGLAATGVTEHAPMPDFEDVEPWWTRLNHLRNVSGPC